MYHPDNRHSMTRWLLRIWEGLIEPAWRGNAKEHHLARILNILLVLLFALGVATEIQYRIAHKQDEIVLIMLGILGFAYFLNRKGYFQSASILTVSLLVFSTFLSAALQYQRGVEELSVLYYLIIAVLLSELLFPMWGYFSIASIILAGMFVFSQLEPATESTFLFLFVFCILIGFSSYNRRSMENEQVALTGKFVRGQSLLYKEQRRAAQMSLLEEAGRQITNSLYESEILDGTLKVIVDKFGYAEAAISLLVDDDILEIFAISGTQDFGYRTGYQQKIGKGIIGRVGEIRKHYVSDNVSVDPYYYSTAKRDGSALGVPMLDKDELLGVIYVETTLQNYFQPDDIQTLQTLANQVAISLQKARLYARSQEHLQVMTMLQSVSQAVMSSLELEEILHNVMKLLKETFGYTYISIYLLDEDVLRLGVEFGYPKEMIIREIPITSGVAGRAVQSKQVQFLPDISKDPSFLRASYDVRSEICVPLLKKDTVLGILNVESNTSLDEDDVNLLNALAGSLAIAIDNARLHAQVKSLAMTDAVSGLFNRHAFEEMLTAEVERAHRYMHPVSLIIFDIDSFKEYNDTWGHPAGDKRLKATADLIRATQRKHDIAARYGGDEFAIILPNTDYEGAKQFAARLHESAKASASEKPEHGRGIPGHTLSLGFATYPDDAQTIPALLLAADHAELMAKRQGKNQIVSASVLKKP